MTFRSDISESPLALDSNIGSLTRGAASSFTQDQIPQSNIIQVKRSDNGVYFDAVHAMMDLEKRWKDLGVLQIKFGDLKPKSASDIIFDADDPEQLYDLCRRVSKDGNKVGEGRYYKKFQFPKIILLPKNFYSNIREFQSRKAHGEQGERLITFRVENHMPGVGVDTPRKMVMVYGLKMARDDDVASIANIDCPHYRVGFKAEIAHVSDVPRISQATHQQNARIDPYQPALFGA